MRRLLTLYVITLLSCMVAVVPAQGRMDGRLLAQGATVPAGVSRPPMIRVPAPSGFQPQSFLKANQTSSNWSGYAAETNLTTPASNSVSDVTGTWVVPTVTGGSSNGYSSDWIGIDGFASSSVEQLGTEADWVGGSASYSAWWEMYPAAAHDISMAIHPGDVMSAEVKWVSSNTFTLSLTNVTTGATFSTQQTVGSAASRSSAEWIHEAPASGSGQLPLAATTPVTFSACNATINGTNGPIGSASWQNTGVDMVQSGTTVSQAGALTAGGTSFVVGPPSAMVPHISASSSSLSFGYTIGGSAPTAQSLTFTNTGGGTLSWSAASDSPSWMTCAPSSGGSGASTSVSVNPASLAAGTYVGHVSVTASGADNTPLSVPVTLVVTPPPPVTTLSTTPTPNAAGWNSTTVTVSVDATDPLGPGVATTYYTLDGAQHTYTATFTIPADGVHTLHYWSVDASGGVEASKTATVKVDTTPPSLSVSPAGPFTVSATVHATASDALSGLGQVEMKLDAGGWSTTTQVSTSVLGSHTAYARAFDVAGNERNASMTFNVVPPPPDTTPPTTTFQVSPAMNAAGWNNTSVLGTLSAVDNQYGSGVAHIDYQLDSAGVQLYSGPFPITSEGVHTVDYRSVDVSGNPEAFQHATIRIDKTAPHVSSDAVGSYVGTATIHIAGSDSLSGLAKIEYALDSSGWTSGTVVTTKALGPHTLQMRATDVAGNFVIASVGFAVTASDDAPPTTRLNADPASNTAGWNDTTVTVSLIATDGPAGSGVAATYYTIDGTQHAYASTFTITAEGVHPLGYWSVDASANAEATKTTTIRLDETAPSLSIDATSSYIGTATISATASDTLSGMGRVEFKLDSGAWSTRTQLSTSVLGPHTVYVRAFDLAGNERDASATFAVRVSRSTTTKLSGPSTVKVKKILAFTGTVSPKAAPGTVTITNERLVGKVWRSVGPAVKVKVVGGRFKYSFKPTSKGNWRFVAKYSGGVTSTSVYWSSKSATKTVKVQ